MCTYIHTHTHTRCMMITCISALEKNRAGKGNNKGGGILGVVVCTIIRVQKALERRY